MVKVSIIVPVFNRSDRIVKTLLSIKNQTFDKFECIIVDDGSTDNTVAVIEELIKGDERFVLLSRPAHYTPGGNGARNYGFDQSTGDWINWFDSDDIMLENFIAEKLNLIGAETEIVIAPHSIINEDGNVLKNNYFYIKDGLLEDYVYWHDNMSLVTNNVLFSKEFLLKHNLRLNENLNRCQEAELFSRAFSLDPKYVISPNITFLYVIHAGNKSSVQSKINMKHKADFVHVNLINFKYAVARHKGALAYYLNCRLIDDILKYNKLSKSFSWNIYFRMAKILLPRNYKWLWTFFTMPIYIFTNVKFPLSQRIFYRNIFKY